MTKPGYDVIFCCAQIVRWKVEVRAQELKGHRYHFYWLTWVAAAVALLDCHPKFFDTVFGRWTGARTILEPASQ